MSALTLPTDTSTEGHVATAVILGRPNAGKSTLLNALVGQRVALPHRKAQTTQQVLRGLMTEGDLQVQFLDTPGLNPHPPHKRHRHLNREAVQTLNEADVVLCVVTVPTLNDLDRWAIEQLAGTERPCVLCLNKTDLLRDHDQLFPLTEACLKLHPFTHVVPLSAKRQQGLADLKDVLRSHARPGLHLYPADFHDFQSDESWCCECIRGQLLNNMHAELPYTMTVGIDRWEDTPKRRCIHATITVERPSQKGMLIGRQGAQLKRIGERARQLMADHWNKPVELRLWVKVAK